MYVMHTGLWQTRPQYNQYKTDMLNLEQMAVEEGDAFEIPEEYLPSVIRHIESFSNDTEDFSGAHLRPSMKTIYPLFAVMYFLVFSVGVTGNILMLKHLIKFSLYFQDSTHLFLTSLAVSNLIYVAFVLPFTFVNLIIHNWIFGRIFCYVLPMAQVSLHLNTFQFNGGNIFWVL